jgi:Flp pilus assembly protein TadG
MTRHPERAQALVFLALALPIFVATAGLAIDGALLLAQRRELQSTVDGAARAGATRVDMQLLRASGGSDVQLDLERARTAGAAYLDQTLPRTLAWRSRPEWQIDVSRTRVRVTVAGRLNTAFLRVVGMDQVPIGATADAAVQYGVRAPAP